MSDPKFRQKVRDLEIPPETLNYVAETEIAARLLLDTNLHVNNFRTLSKYVAQAD